ncbi:hypothetical protein F511_37753 [Dorcoceras hygrometricum]|uniref:Uncharacterized protein n=1 Tax=Dorcoceras hygrometricum TaxID=472368 RepID=A0A2Z7CUM5_9LAMI|nr:hypothetical protein F511_37753 [Dorcoceras hygrometricum]
MDAMFKALESSELGGFLGVSRSIYEQDMTQFFTSAKVVDGAVVSIVWYASGDFFTDVYEEFKLTAGFSH